MRTPDAVRDELVKNMTSLVSVDETGTGYFENDAKREKRARFSENVWFLYSVLAEDHKVVSRLNKEKLALDRPTIDLPGKELINIFATLKKENKITFEEFRARFLQMINEEAKKPETEYTVVYPLNTKLPTDVGQALGNERLKRFTKAIVKEEVSQNPFNFGFEIANYDEFVKELPTWDPKSAMIMGEKAPQIQTEIASLFNDDHVFFISRDYGRNPSYVELRIRKRLKAFLGLWILIKNVDRSKFFGFCSEPLSNLLCSYSFAFEKDKFVDLYSLCKTSVAAEPTSWAEFNKVIQQFLYGKLRVIRNADIANILFEALQLYYEASIDRDVAHSCLKFWICTERCMLKTAQIPGKQMVDSIRKLDIWIDETGVFGQKLEKLLDKRHSYVHELDAQISQLERLFAKTVSEGLLTFLLVRANEFDAVGELQRFFYAMSESC